MQHDLDEHRERLEVWDLAELQAKTAEMDTADAERRQRRQAGFELIRAGRRRQGAQLVGEASRRHRSECERIKRSFHHGGTARSIPDTKPMVARGTRARGAGRPASRGNARRSSARSGDSGSDSDGPGGAGDPHLAAREAAAQRIRCDPRWQRCHCFRPAEPLQDGRCSRCYGNLEEGR